MAAPFQFRRLRPWSLLLLVLVLMAAACGGGDDDSDVSATDESSTTVTTEEETTTTTEAEATTTAPPETTVTTAKPAVTTTAGPLSGEIIVLAAASLTEAFTEMGQAFQAAHPNATVKFSFDSSSTLATQANNGAPADLFASAEDTNMKKVTDTGVASDPKTFARNRLALLVGKGNPKNITTVKDLDRSDIIYVLCALQVPCGKYGDEILKNAGVTAQPKSYEANVKAVVTKVTTGEADAGIVYVTDAKAAAANSDSVDITDDLNVTASYPIALLKQSTRLEVTRAFRDFVLSPQGQQILNNYGFLSA